MLSTSKIEEVSSRRIASFLMLSSLKNKEVSQNCFDFKLQIDRWTNRQTDRQTARTIDR